VKIPADQEIKVWLRYSSIIFLKDEKLTYTLNNYLQNTNSLKPKREVFQVYISELTDLKDDPTITCNGKVVKLDDIPGFGASDPYEYFGVYDAGQGQPPLCKTGRRARLGSFKVEIQYEVERKFITGFDPITGKAKDVEDHHGDILIQG